MSGTYRVVCADPPWQFNDELPGPGRGASKYYSCLPVTDLCAFHLPDMMSDSYLFVWRVASMVEEAYRVVRAWGFVPKSEIVWVKKTVHGKRHFGMGHHVRAEHETCIIATRGRPKPLVRNIRSTFEASVGRHSAKPEAFYDLVEGMCAGPYVELFARRQRSGWTCLGNEL